MSATEATVKKARHPGSFRVATRPDPQHLPDVAPRSADQESAPAQPHDDGRLTVIVPAYNEEQTVAELLRRVLDVKCVTSIVLVDDGSTDETQQKVTSVSCDDRRVRVVRHRRNRGKGRAIRTALDHVRTQYVIIQDADLEYDPADIPKLLAAMRRQDVDAVFGSRYLDRPQVQPGRFFLQSGVRFLNVVTHVLYGLTLTDEATCYKMFRTDDLRRMNLRCESFEFCPEVVAKAALFGLSIVELPIRYSPRRNCAGKKLRWWDGFRAIRVLVCLRMFSSQTPSRILE